MIGQIPKYFLYKIKYAKPHQFMQVNNFILMRTEEKVLYKLPNDEEVYGSDQEIVITDYSADLPTYMPKWYNPKTREWVDCITKEEKDWLVSRSNLEYDLRFKEFESICYDSDNGYIQFDVLGWLHKNISPAFYVNEDFYYYGHVFIGETCYDLSRIIEDDASVKSSKELVLVCRREGNTYNITEELKRYFAKKKPPIDVDTIFNKVKNGEMTLQEFQNWVRN